MWIWLCIFLCFSVKRIYAAVFKLSYTTLKLPETLPVSTACFLGTDLASQEGFSWLRNNAVYRVGFFKFQSEFLKDVKRTQIWENLESNKQSMNQVPSSPWRLVVMDLHHCLSLTLAALTDRLRFTHLLMLSSISAYPLLEYLQLFSAV